LAASLTAVPVPDTSRAYAASHQPATIAEAARSLGARAIEAENFEAALAGLIHNAEPIRVLIAGSLHLAGAVLEAEEGAPARPPRT
jgi:folylpolyglutamate synthase/dihydropteroate synthase